MNSKPDKLPLGEVPVTGSLNYGSHHLLGPHILVGSIFGLMIVIPNKFGGSELLLGKLTVLWVFARLIDSVGIRRRRRSNVLAVRELIVGDSQELFWRRETQHCARPGLHDEVDNLTVKLGGEEALANNARLLRRHLAAAPDLAWCNDQ
jgi:hypothetical protein